jgi:hypothetical protein
MSLSPSVRPITMAGLLSLELLAGEVVDRMTTRPAGPASPTGLSPGSVDVNAAAP